MFRTSHPEMYYEKERRNASMALALENLSKADFSNEEPDADIAERNERVLGTKLDEVE